MIFKVKINTSVYEKYKILINAQSFIEIVPLKNKMILAVTKEEERR